MVTLLFWKKIGNQRKLFNLRTKCLYGQRLENNNVLEDIAANLHEKLSEHKAVQTILFYTQSNQKTVRSIPIKVFNYRNILEQSDLIKPANFGPLTSKFNIKRQLTQILCCCQIVCIRLSWWRCKPHSKQEQRQHNI